MSYEDESLPAPPPPAIVENDDVVHAPDEPEPEAELLPSWEGEVPALLCRNSAEKTPC